MAWLLSGAAWGACPASHTDGSQVYMCGWHPLVERSFHFPKGQVGVIPANTGKPGGFCPMAKASQCFSWPKMTNCYKACALGSASSLEKQGKRSRTSIALVSTKPGELMTPAQTCYQSEQRHYSCSPPESKGHDTGPPKDHSGAASSGQGRLHVVSTGSPASLAPLQETEALSKCLVN